MLKIDHFSKFRGWDGGGKRLMEGWVRGVRGMRGVGTKGCRQKKAGKDLPGRMFMMAGFYRLFIS
jgi:hypothetical protein